MKSKETNAAKPASKLQATGIVLPMGLEDWSFRIPFEEADPVDPSSNNYGMSPEQHSVGSISYNMPAGAPPNVMTRPEVVTDEYTGYVFKGPGTGTTQDFSTLGYVKYDVDVDCPIKAMSEFTISLWINTRIFGPAPVEAGVAPFIFINGGETGPQVVDHHGSYYLGLQDTAETTQLRVKGYFWDANDEVEWNGQEQDITYPEFTPGEWIHIIQRYSADGSLLDMFCLTNEAWTGAEPPAPLDSQVKYAGPYDPISQEQPLLGPLAFQGIENIYLAAWEDWVVKGDAAASWQKNSYGGMMEDIIFWDRPLSNEEIEGLHNVYCTAAASKK